MTVIIHPIPQAVRPVTTAARITDSGLRWGCARRWRRRTILVRYIACKCDHTIIVRVVGRGMIEKGFLRSSTGIGRIKKRRDRLQRREITFRRGAAHAEEEDTKESGCENVFYKVPHKHLNCKYEFQPANCFKKFRNQ